MRLSKALVASLCGMLMLSGCALFKDAEPEKDASESPSAEQSDEEGGSSREPREADPDVAPRAFDTEGATTFEETDVYDGVISDDRVITMTLDRVRARALSDLSLAWDLSPDGIFFDLEVSSDGEEVYVVDYVAGDRAGTAVGEMELTVRRLSASNGAVLGEATWKNTADAQSPGQPGAGIVGVVDDVVLVETWGNAEGARHTLTALDVSTGDEVWTQRPGTLVAVGDDKAVVTTATSRSAGELKALDIESGDEAWSNPDRVSDVREVGVHDGTLTVVRTDEDDEATLARVNLADGETSPGRRVDTGQWSCLPATAGRVVCTLPDQEALGFDLARDRITWQLPTDDRFGVWVTSVNDNVVYGFTSQGSEVMLDAASGRDIAESPGVAPNATNGYGGLLLYTGRALFYPSVEEPEDEE